jgi:hypothetical protein
MHRRFDFFLIIVIVFIAYPHYPHPHRTQPSIFSLPSAAVLRERGQRIPVDYLTDDDDILDADPDAPSPSHAANQALLDAAPVPLTALAVEPKYEVVKAVFWSPPRVDRWAHTPSDPTPANAYQRLEAANQACAAQAQDGHVLLLLVTLQRAGPSVLCRYIVSHDGSSARLSAAVPVAKKSTCTTMAVAPNGHFIAIATTSDLLILTGPAAADARDLHLQAAGQDPARAPPLTVVASRARCFEMPCTGVSFDPSSRLAAAVCATRAIVFLSVGGRRPAVEEEDDEEEPRSVCGSAWALLLQLLAVALVAVLVARYQQAAGEAAHYV